MESTFLGTVQRSNPYTPTIRDAQDIIDRLDAATTRLCFAIAANAEAQAQLRDAQQQLSAGEAEIIFEEGMKPDGALKGIATTSKMYGHALETLTWRAKQFGHPLFDRATELRAAAHNADLAATELAQAQSVFSALKHMADLKGNILAAGS